MDYTTKYAANILVGNEWISIALFSSSVQIQSMKDFVLSEAYCAKAENAQIIDMETGEIIYDYLDEVENSDEPAESDLEMGFNPYLGTYDFDC